MKNADQPAMPMFDSDGYPKVESGAYTSGLTKREMMAMHIAQGLLVSAGYKGSHCRELAEHTVRYTDALLAELEHTR